MRREREREREGDYIEERRGREGETIERWVI